MGSRIARSRSRVAAVALLVGLVAGGVASYAFAASGDECSKPISERVGGWTCPGS